MLSCLESIACDNNDIPKVHCFCPATRNTFLKKKNTEKKRMPLTPVREPYQISGPQIKISCPSSSCLRKVAVLTSRFMMLVSDCSQSNKLVIQWYIERLPLKEKVFRIFFFNLNESAT